MSVEHTEQSNPLISKNRTLVLVYEIGGILIFLAGFFYAGMKFQQGQDSAMIDLLREKIIYYESQLNDSLSIEEFFANLDYAQMSPSGEHRVLFGTSPSWAPRLPFGDSIVAAMNAIEHGEFGRARAILYWAAKEQPKFPYTQFYFGIIEQLNTPKRALPYFIEAHSRFSFLLKIKPNNTALRLYDAMALTFLGYGDSATTELYHIHKSDPEWLGITCERLILMYDSTSLSHEERQVWAEFINSLSEMKCDTVKLSKDLDAINRVSPVPKINWPAGYDRFRR